jgi:hypothetical protein
MTCAGICFEGCLIGLHVCGVRRTALVRAVSTCAVASVSSQFINNSSHKPQALIELSIWGVKHSVENRPSCASQGEIFRSACDLGVLGVFSSVCCGFLRSLPFQNSVPCFPFSDSASDSQASSYWKRGAIEVDACGVYGPYDRQGTGCFDQCMIDFLLLSAFCGTSFISPPCP